MKHLAHETRFYASHVTKQTTYLMGVSLWGLACIRRAKGLLEYAVVASNTAVWTTYIASPMKPSDNELFTPCFVGLSCVRKAKGLLEYAVVAGGTGGGDVVVGPHEAQVHGQ